MAITAVVDSNITTTETLPISPNESTNVTHRGMNTTASLAGTSTPAISKLASFTATLTSGALTIDLTNLTTALGLIVTGNGLRVQAIKLQAPTSNANPFTAVPGASNGYAAAGGGFNFHTGGSVTLNPGDEILWTNTTGTSAPAVGGSAKTLDLSGTGAQTLNITILFG